MGFLLACAHLPATDALISTVTAIAYITHKKLVAVIQQTEEGTVFAWRPKLAFTLLAKEWMDGY